MLTYIYMYIYIYQPLYINQWIVGYLLVFYFRQIHTGVMTALRMQQLSSHRSDNFAASRPVVLRPGGIPCRRGRSKIFALGLMGFNGV